MNTGPWESYYHGLTKKKIYTNTWQLASRAYFLISTKKLMFLTKTSRFKSLSTPNDQKNKTRKEKKKVKAYYNSLKLYINIRPV